MLFCGFLIVCGLYIGARLGFFCFLHPIETVRTLIAPGKGDKGGYSPGRALTVALAGTLGVGNITGVAAAILLGGSGALFWMWVSAIATMLIKYTEVVLAVDTRVPTPSAGGVVYHGGPMRYLRLLPFGRVAAGAFSVLCVAASFIQGNILQMSAASVCLSETWDMPPMVPALLLTLGALFVIFGGRDRIAAFTGRMIPLMTGLYLLAGLAIIFANASRLPCVFADIFENAFSPRGVGGGAGAALAMYHGCAKGVFSHEAGCGTAPISHAGAETDSAHRQGLLGIAEVTIDTLLLCTVTGLLLLLTGAVEGCPGGDYTALVLYAFSVCFGRAGAVFLTVSMVFYAFATLVCWSFYGTESVRALGGGEGARRRYLLLFALLTPVGVFAGSGALWRLSDVLCIAMTVLNTTALLYLVPRVAGRRGAETTGRRLPHPIHAAARPLRFAKKN